MEIDIKLTKKEADYLNTLLHCELLFRQNESKCNDYKDTLWGIKKKVFDALTKKVIEK